MNIQHADDLTAKYRRFRLDEAEAHRERTLDTVIVPGPLQIPESAAGISQGRRRLERAPGWEQHAGAEGRERQALLDRETEPLELHALVHEAALRTHGAMSGPWFLLSFPEDDESDAAYTGSVTGTENVGAPEDMARLAEVWQAIAETAPSPQPCPRLMHTSLRRAARMRVHETRTRWSRGRRPDRHHGYRGCSSGSPASSMLDAYHFGQ